MYLDQMLQVELQRRGLSRMEASDFFITVNDVGGSLPRRDALRVLSGIDSSDDVRIEMYARAGNFRFYLEHGNGYEVKSEWSIDEGKKFSLYSEVPTDARTLPLDDLYESFSFIEKKTFESIVMQMRRERFIPERQAVLGDIFDYFDFMLDNGGELYITGISKKGFAFMKDFFEMNGFAFPNIKEKKLEFYLQA